MKSILFCSMLICLLFSFGAHAQKASNGLITYSGEEKLSLGGEWEVYWDTLFVSNPGPRKFKYANIPEKWTGDNFPVNGKATCRLTIHADKAYDHLGAFVPETNAASELYLNGKMISNSGVVDDDPLKCDPRWIPEFIYFHLDSGANVLVWQMANYHHSKGGANKAIVIGPFEKLLDQREMQVSVALFVVGSLIVLSLFFFGLHLFWNKNPATLYVAIMMFTYGIRHSVYDLHLLNKAIPDAPWWLMTRVEYLSTYLSLLFVIIFFESIFPDEFNRKIARFFKAYFLVFIALIVLTPIAFFSKVHFISLGVFVLALLYNFYVMTQAFLNNKVSGYLAFSFVGTVSGASLLAIAIYLGWMPYIPYIEYVSSLLYAMTSSFVMAVRFAEQFRQAETLQIKTQEQNEIITQSLAEKELLLGEIHHRVKNNLQTINSLLFLQSQTISDPKAVKMIQESQYRIQTMALVHQKLYQTKENGLGVEVKNYFQELVRTILDTLEERQRVLVQQEVDEIVLDIDTVIHVGLIINELVVNSMKYAFDQSITEPTITILLRQEEAHLRLEIRDNGKGYDQNNSSERKDSFGLKLIRSLSRKLECEPIISSGQSGTSVSFIIKHYSIIA
ncbi:MAG: histidine kinase dimerization/phosphoacceptor domain -containing protein [Reichenbachiella sp.]|uniref:sensor histidine kinase n=1 Tax=Reichenbachiella sp. TaxID=2184521 RepID=UPI003299736A